RPHSSIQVVPITRPSLRDGRTAYAVLSREPNSFWPPSPRELTMPSARLGSRTSPRQLERSNDGQDHTVLPYARPALSPQYSRPRRQSRELTNETKPDSTVRLHAVSSSQGLPALPAPLVPTLPRPPHPQPTFVTTYDRPSPRAGMRAECCNSEFR